MAAESQLDFLAKPDDRPAWIRTLTTQVQDWADQGVYFGTSSWKYPGWLGQLYQRSRYHGSRGQFSQKRFDRECLTEYAETFSSVCGDFAFYQFYPQPFWDRLFALVPPSFQFGFKVPEQITCPRFPTHARYGAQAGQVNPDFLNAELFSRGMLDRLAPHVAQVGYLVLEFPRFHRPTHDSNQQFIDHLDRFLGQLPHGFRYGVEIRTASVWELDEYRTCLQHHRVSHVFNSWTHMPSVADQLTQTGCFTADVTIARLLLRPGRMYQDAVSRFQPYDRVGDPYPEGYRAAAQLVEHAKRRASGQKVYLAVNNRFVGSALHAIEAILQELEQS